MSAPRSILVIVTRRIGDVLLATPLMHSLKRAWPDAAIDALVFKGTEGVIAANTDLREVITIAERPTAAEHAAFFAGLRRRYDIAVSVQPGDRPTLYAWWAGKRRVGTLLADRKNRWKRALLHEWVPFDDLDTHTVRMNLRLAELLGVAPATEVAVARREADHAHVKALVPPVAEGRPFALLHPFPMFAYKAWHDAGWTALAGALASRGIAIVLVGGPAPEERAHADRLMQALPPGTVNLVGRLNLSEVGCLASRAALYVGTDTAVTHIAAATGVPTIALFGPSNPVKWGPWPRGFDGSRNPWNRCGSQTVGNVTLIQGTGACVPCLLEGCDRMLASPSDCLQRLPAQRVIEAALKFARL